ncbi:MAG: 50S ribosomal protein L11 methyltransferase [Ginsengibacter sp.]
METFIKIDIFSITPERSEILIAELSELNFYAFEENKNLLTAYIREDVFDNVAFESSLKNREEYKLETIRSQNWNEKWESDLQPVLIGKFAGIRASFHESLEQVDHEIIITPKMSFGTGHHATTALMIEQMSEIDFFGKNVLDFGTGTGVLAILAEKLGANKILAIDNDEWSITNALENLQANACKKIKIQKKESICDDVGQDVILANINLNVLLQHAVNIASITNEEGFVLLSGFLENDKDQLVQEFEKYGFTKKNVRKKNEWTSILFKKIINA